MFRIWLTHSLPALQIQMLEPLADLLIAVQITTILQLRSLLTFEYDQELFVAG